METIFELFAALNSAIDAGVMTQEVIAFAAMAIARQVTVEWKAGRIDATQLRCVVEEMEQLRNRWNACSRERLRRERRDGLSAGVSHGPARQLELLSLAK